MNMKKLLVISIILLVLFNIAQITAVAQQITQDNNQFTITMQEFNPRNRVLTLFINGKHGAYYVEILNGAQQLYYDVVTIPGTIVVSLPPMQMSDRYIMRLTLNIYDDKGHKLYTSGLYIDVVAPKPSIMITGAKWSTNAITLFLNVYTSVKTTVTIYVDGTPKITDTISTPKQYNITIPLGKMVTLKVVCETDYSVTELPLYLFVPSMKKTAQKTITQAKLEIKGIYVSRNHVSVTVQTPEKAEVTLYVDNKPISTKTINAGINAITFIIPELSSGTHVVRAIVKTESGNTTESMKTITIEQQGLSQQQQIILGLLIVIAIVIIYTLHKRGIIDLSRLSG